MAINIINSIDINTYGIVGFLGFEALKYYRKYENGEPLFYNKQYLFYSILLLIIAIFSGVLAEAFASDNKAEAIFIGFSVPTNIKIVFNKMTLTKNRENITNDDDIDHKTPRNIKSFLTYIYLIFFRF